MVVFTCGHCGESVQKPKVEKHYQTKCRNRNPNLSCMDCFKDFLGNAYETHTKCITEEQRYSGKGFQAKEKKGEKKQTAWVEMVQSVLDEQKNAPANVRRIIETISKHQNTPRKKPKFINFVKNVCGPKTNPRDVDQAWDMISVKLAALSNANNQNKNQTSNGNASENATKEENGLDDSAVQENGHVNGNNDETNVDKENLENGEAEETNENGTVENTDKKLSKKQRKEEKKRKKYEAELQSAVEVPEEIEDEETQVVNKKGKKKKNKSECSNGDVDEVAEGKNNKNKKRKRQDTTNSVPEIIDNLPLEAENAPATKEKTVKKKLKVDGNEDADDSICLHDQNVAKIEELSMKGDKFNWHATIMIVLEKKGEMPFKRLQKKVLSEYSEATGRDVDDRIADKFIKKLKSCPQVRVDKNRVYIEE